MATLTLTPTTASVVEGSGLFLPSPAITALADDGSTSVASTVTVSPIDFNAALGTAGTQVFTYTLPKNVSGGADEVATKVTKTFTLTITAAPGETQEFIDGLKDRFGNDTTGTEYQVAVQNAQADPSVSPDEVMAGLFDENGLDPYELANAKKNV